MLNACIHHTLWLRNNICDSPRCSRTCVYLVRIWWMEWTTNGVKIATKVANCLFMKITIYSMQHVRRWSLSLVIRGSMLYVFAPIKRRKTKMLAQNKRMNSFVMWIAPTYFYFLWRCYSSRLGIKSIWFVCNSFIPIQTSDALLSAQRQTNAIENGTVNGRSEKFNQRTYRCEVWVGPVGRWGVRQCDMASQCD